MLCELTMAGLHTFKIKGKISTPKLIRFKWLIASQNIIIFDKYAIKQNNNSYYLYQLFYKNTFSH